jgi:hypothetical protein
MTLPYERTNAVNTTRSFLEDLINPKATPRIPQAIRKQALWCLRHYPSAWEMDVVSQRESKDNDPFNSGQVFGINPWLSPKVETKIND